MSEKFVASNGIELEMRDSGSISGPSGWWCVNSEWVQALREFYQHLRDTELGRWRWPENPDYVVVRLKKGRVRVTNERTGNVNDITRNTHPTRSDNSPGAANAYWAAHSNTKPWHDAKPGEVWLFKAKGSATKPSAFTFSAYGDLWINSAGIKLESKYTEDRPYGVSHDPDFVPRRIWPESD